MDGYTGEERRACNHDDRRSEHWHFDKSVSISHLLTTAAIIISVITWAMKTDTRISVIENQIQNNKELMIKTDITQRDNMHEIKATLVRIEAKIDRKVDKP